MFMLQKAPLIGNGDLTLLALGESGARMWMGDALLESIAWKQKNSQFDIVLTAGEAQESLCLSLQYNTDLFERETIRRMLARFETLIAGILTAPHEAVNFLSMLDAAERRQLMFASNGHATGPRTDPGAEGECIHTLFEIQAHRTPVATALVFNDEEISYEDLNRRANQVAHYLRRCGVGPESPVAICMERSLEMVIGILGILKADGAYVPLAMTYPHDRLLTLLSNCGASVLVSKQWISALCGHFSVRPVEVVCLDTERQQLLDEDGSTPENHTTAQNAAYLIYTSGSTGGPKGVMVQHGSVANLFAGMDRVIGCHPEDTLLAVTSISFDNSGLELFWTLTRGARVGLLSEQMPNPGLPSTHPHVAREIQFSLFYFSSDSPGTQAAQYRLVTEGARFAAPNGFTAVWTPERHFHEFGVLYPNPSVMSAMLAGITERIAIPARR